MMNLYRVEKTLAANEKAEVIALPCSVKKLEWACAGTAGVVRFFDGHNADGRCVAQLNAAANSTDRISCNSMETFNFATAVYVTATQAGTVALYCVRNPNATYATP